MVEVTPWDASELLADDRTIAAYLDAAFEDGDPGLIAAAIGDVAKARGMSQIARDTGLSRESLYKALSADRRAEFSTILKVLKAVGFGLRTTPQPASSNDRRLSTHAE